MPSAFGNAVSLASWVRAGDGPDRLQKALALTPAVPEDAEAHDRFGKPTPIELRDDAGGLQPAPSIRVTFNWPDRQDDQTDTVEVLDYYEIARTVDTVRISNPEDDAQYVDVERIQTITFQGPDGRQHRFNLNNSG